MRVKNVNELAFAAAVALLALGCGTTTTTTGSPPDLTMKVQPCTASCTGKACGADDGCGSKCQTGSCTTGTCSAGVCMTSGLGCYAVFQCYLAGNGGSGCQDTPCFAACDAMAKTPQDATDAETLVNCLDKAIGPDANDPGPCWGACNDSMDMAGDPCAQCLYGTCQTMANGAKSCMGGQCSAEGAGCFNEK